MEDTTLDPVFAAAAAGPGQPLTWRQGLITAFNPNTLQNTVYVGQAFFSDLPLLGVAEADTYAPGSVVGILCTPNEWMILGRLVRPNTAEAIDAINKLSNSIKAAAVSTGETTTSTTFVDLATYGPVVSTTVRSSGRLLVIISASIGTVADPAGTKGGAMSVQVDGPVGTITAASLPFLGHDYDDTGHVLGDSVAAARAILLEGLGAGDYTVTAKYRAQASGATTNFADRTLITLAI